MSRVNIIAVVVVLLTVVWMFTLGDDAVYRIQQRALAMASPFIKTRNQIQETSDSVSKPKMSYTELYEEYERLLKENEQLRIATQALDQLWEENSELKSALQFRRGYSFQLVAAEVIERETATWYHTMVINKGEADGVTKDAPVVVPEGLVGKITLVSDKTSVVLLLTDESCKVSARVIGTEQSGILEGQVQERIVGQGEVTGERGAVHSGPTLKLRYLDSSNLSPNQDVYSSGRGGIFPENLYLGKIVSVTEGQVTSEAEIAPDVDFEALKFVFVITGEKE